MAEQSVVSVVALEISDGKESEFLALTGQMQGLVRKKGYGTNQLLRDGSHPRRYYDIRIWRNADTAAKAESDGDIKGLRRDLEKYLRSTPLVDVAWAVEMGLAAAGPWQERRVRRGSERPGGSAIAEPDVQRPGPASGHDRRIALRRGDAPLLTAEWTGQPNIVHAARIARERAKAAFSDFKVGAALETDGRAHHHRLQRREFDLRPHDVRRACGDLQGGFRRAPIVHAHCGRRRYPRTDHAMRRMPPDAVGVRRRHRGDSCGSHAISRRAIS